MKQFSEFGIKPSLPGFIGDKIKIERVLNRKIIIHDFRIEDSKFGNKTKCLYLQIELNATKHIIFTGSYGLLEQIQQVPKSEFPFTATIIKENDRYEFT